LKGHLFLQKVFNPEENYRLEQTTLVGRATKGTGEPEKNRISYLPAANWNSLTAITKE
jgi:hypothetical protein